MYTNLNDYLAVHRKGEPATPPIAPFSSRLASLLLLAGNDHAASALSPTLPRRGRGRSIPLPLGEGLGEGCRLASQLEKRTLGCVQLPFLG